MTRPGIEPQSSGPLLNTLYYSYIQIRLNKIELLDFIYKLETNNTLPFLDILLIYNNNKLELKVHHKSNYRNNWIYFYSHHNIKIKRGIIIGFYFWGLTIYTPKFLNYEFDDVKISFTLQNP